MREKTCYKYQLKMGKKVVFRGITYDLNRREAERQQRFPSSRIKQIGRRTTWEAASIWVGKGGKRPYSLTKGVNDDNTKADTR